MGDCFLHCSFESGQETYLLKRCMGCVEMCELNIHVPRWGHYQEYLAIYRYWIWD